MVKSLQPPIKFLIKIPKIYFIFFSSEIVFWVVDTVEQQFLEREIGNLKFRKHQQQPQPQQNQKQTQQNRYNNYRPPTTQEPESQFAALAI